jgi:hypothetical protein
MRAAMIAIYFYDVVLSLHIAAIVIAFGVTFAYPLMTPFVKRAYPRSMPALHAAQGEIGKKIIAPGGGIALLAGIYLAADRDYFSEVWVTIPMVILVGLLIMGGTFFSKIEDELVELSQASVDAAGPDGDVRWSAEYEARFSRLMSVGLLSNVAVLVALFFMTAKPFA